MARPTKLTAEKIMAINAALRVGSFREAAAGAAGVNRTTLYRWLQRGAGDRAGTLHRLLHETVVQAEVDFECFAIAVIRKAAERDWRAAIFLLERRWPERWAAKRPQRAGAAVGVSRPAHVPPVASERLCTPEESQVLLNFARAVGANAAYAAAAESATTAGAG